MKYGFITQDSRILLHGVIECVLYVGSGGGWTLIRKPKNNNNKSTCETVRGGFTSLSYILYEARFWGLERLLESFVCLEAF